MSVKAKKHKRVQKVWHVTKKATVFFLVSAVAFAVLFAAGEVSSVSWVVEHAFEGLAVAFLEEV